RAHHPGATAGLPHRARPGHRRRQAAQPGQERHGGIVSNGGSVWYMVRVTVPQLWQPSVAAGFRELAEAVVALRDEQRLSFPQIAEELNRRKLLGPAGYKFYPQLAYSI